MSGPGRLYGLRDRDLAAEGLMLLEGSLLMERALAAGMEIMEAACVPAAGGRWAPAAAGRFPLRIAPEAELAAMAGYPFHRGVLGLARRPPLPRCAPDGSGLTGAPVLCAWGLSDPSNLGALARSAAALGADALIIGPACADPFSRKALRSSMGALLSLPLLGCENEATALGACLAAGLASAAAVAEGGAAPSALRAAESRPIALFLGHEGRGLPESLVRGCDRRVSLPMSGKTDSLNVAAAGAILMWECFGPGLAQSGRRS